MAFTDQTLSKDSATDADSNTQVFSVRYADSDGSKFAVSGLTAPDERTLAISHTTDKNGNVRTVVRIDCVAVDSNLVPATASVYFNMVRPPSSAFSNADIIGLTNQLVDFLIEGGSNANVTKLINQEV
jgi:3D (Asp-Asp-Asp) domain-containing protein